MAKVSVVITVHNAEKYIRECLDSVVNQTFTDLEILCIDGGSTDSTPSILQEYQDKDTRVKIINDKNTSYGHKINVGVDAAMGEYISFLESDDKYCLDMLEKLVPIMDEYHPDFADGDYADMYDCDGESFYYHYQRYPSRFYGYLRDAGDLEDVHLITRYWTGLFDRNFLIKNNIRLNESPGASFQDITFRFLISVLNKKAFHIRDVVYLYRVDNAESSVFDQKKTLVTASEYEYLKNDLVQRKITNENIWYQFYRWKYVDLYFNIWRFVGAAKDQAYECVMNELSKDLDIILSRGYEEKVWEIQHLRTWSKEEIFIQSDKDNARENGIRENRNRFSSRLIGKHVVVFGAGKDGSDFIDTLAIPKDKIRCYCDNSEEKRKLIIDGKKVIRPEDAVTEYREDLFFIKSRKYSGEMQKQLVELGISEEQIIINPGMEELSIQIPEERWG